MNEYQILAQELIKQQSKFLFINIGILVVMGMITLSVYLLNKNKTKKFCSLILILGNIFLTIIMFVNTAIFTLLVDGGDQVLYEVTKAISSSLSIMSIIGVLISIIGIVLIIFNAPKHKYLGIIIVILSILLALGEINDLKGTELFSEDTLRFELMTYSYNTKDFIDLSVDKIEEKIKNKDRFFLYTGRITCQWCRQFVNILKGVSSNNDFTIFYLDSGNTENNMELKKFREKYNIEYVPELLYFNGEKYSNLIDNREKNNKLSKLDLEARMIQVYIEP